MALDIVDLGIVSYPEALELQEKAVEARRRGAAPDRLFLLEHPPVVTLGRSGREENLRVGRAELARRGVEVHEVGRGGDVTWHGPGQLVGYLVVDLAAHGSPDVGAHLRGVEAALCAALDQLGVPSHTIPGWTGVFAGSGSRSLETPRGSEVARKIASIGVGVRGWVSWHGFALNVDPDLGGFDAIVPCGLHGVEMTSIAHELGGRLASRPTRSEAKPSEVRAPAELGAAAAPDLAARARAAVGACFDARFGKNANPD